MEDGLFRTLSGGILMRKTVLVPIADGIEEIEAVTVIDVLRRGGAEVTVASVDGLHVVASRGVKLGADCPIDDCKGKTYDLIALPGGMPGAEHLRDCRILTEMLTEQKAAGRLYAAICASPVVVLGKHGLLEGHSKIVCHPAMHDKLPVTKASSDRVAVDGNCITSMGPGTAVEFALELVRQLFGEERENQVAGPMVAAGYA
jgi:4-methyl-5(b-hydroxyethyl)-thiazole monophosphate biosynthesis